MRRKKREKKEKKIEKLGDSTTVYLWAGSCLFSDRSRTRRCQFRYYKTTIPLPTHPMVGCYSYHLIFPKKLLVKWIDFVLNKSCSAILEGSIMVFLEYCTDPNAKNVRYPKLCQQKCDPGWQIFTIDVNKLTQHILVFAKKEKKKR